MVDFESLPPHIKAAAYRGLQDPKNPFDPEKAAGDYDSGKKVRKAIGEAATSPTRETTVFCGDCLRDIPYGSSCAHISVGKRGGRNRIN